MIISFPLIDFSEYEAKASHNYGEHTQQRPWSAVRRNPVAIPMQKALISAQMSQMRPSTAV
jgi:hypothetical protein